MGFPSRTARPLSPIANPFAETEMAVVAKSALLLDRGGEVPTMLGSDAGIAQLVEHNLAKVGVASSSLVSRSRFFQLQSPGSRRGSVVFGLIGYTASVSFPTPPARWQSGYAAACKAVYLGSIPGLASSFCRFTQPFFEMRRYRLLAASNGLLLRSGASPFRRLAWNPPQLAV